MNPHRNRRRRTVATGFSMIELLVVMAVVGTLFAILVPAISNCREASRRLQCMNNLAQIGVALHNYSLSHSVLPPGCVNATGPIANLEDGYHMSWLVNSLGRLEQSSLFAQVRFEESAYSPQNAMPRSVAIPSLICPSDDSPRFSSGIVEPSSYAGCTGGIDEPIGMKNTGLLFLNSSIRYAEIRDGASNTILAGERLISDNPSGVDLGWMSGTAATLRFAGVTGAGSTTNASLDHQAGGFSSAHGGRINVVLADGSVRSMTGAGQLWRQYGCRDDSEILSGF